jgi:integrase/recombinase XerC
MPAPHWFFRFIYDRESAAWERRHTTLTWVERNFGFAVARVYAGHTDSGGEAGATSTYVRASLSEVAAALAALTGEPHPLATSEGW